MRTCGTNRFPHDAIRACKYRRAAASGRCIRTDRINGDGLSRLVASALALSSALFITGCDSPYAGCVIGSKSKPGGTNQYCYVVQNVRSNDSGLMPLCGIIWISSHQGEVSTSGNRITSIHGNRVSIKPGVCRIYALLPDYRLEAIEMANPEIDQVFAFLLSTNNQATESDIWRTNVERRLHFINPP